MMNRREFLQAGLAAYPVVGLALSSMAFAGEPAATALYKVIVDDRFPESVAFGAEAHRLRVPVAAIQGDITDVWYHDLYYRWQESPAAIAGLTTNRSLYCLDVFARRTGMRVVYHADHRLLVQGGAEHEVFSASAARDTAALAAAGTHWSAAAARLVLQLPRSACRPVGKIADLLIPEGPPQPLVSWVIAPAARG